MSGTKLHDLFDTEKNKRDVNITEMFNQYTNEYM